MNLFMVAVIYIVGNYQAGQRPDIPLGPSVKASYYGAEFDGRLMANGQPFSKDNLCLAAHPKLRFGTKVLVTNVETGRWLIMEIADRGPKPSTGCGLDISEAAADYLGFKNKGRTHLHIKVISTPAK